MPAPPQITLDKKCHSQQPKRVPRAPNAFILYRSDFLKRGAIPPEVEKRQQNLSRVAGQCWKMLPDTEKALWYGKAAAVRAEYRCRYSSHKTRPFREDKNRLSAKDKRRGSASNPRRSLGCSSRNRMQPPCYENVFSAFSSSAPQTTLISPPPTSKSSSSTTVSLSPMHLLPSFALHTNSRSQDVLPTTFENSRRNEFGDLLESSGSEVAQGKSHLIRDPKDPSGEIGSSQELYPIPWQHERGFATYGSFHGLEQLAMPYSFPVSQFPLNLLETDTLSPAGYCHSLANDFGVTDNVAHFNQSFLYH